MQAQIEAAHFLTGDAGAGLLAQTAALPGDAASRILALRKRRVDLATASLAVEIVAARHRARTRFPDADRLFFTADALAQATSPALAHYHAGGLTGRGRVADLGCGVGMDAISFARAGCQVVAIERDPVRLLFARANARACGVEDSITFHDGDLTAFDWSADVAYLDPSRRENNDAHRVSRWGDRYEPPLSFLDALRGHVRGGCLKLSPALPAEAFAELGVDTTLRFLGENRECKEACVWWGNTRPVDSGAVGAVLLPEGDFWPARDDLPPVGLTGAFLYDPDAALIRAGALGPLAQALAAARISPDDMYLTGDSVPPAALARAAQAYHILDSLPYSARAVGARLRDLGAGRLVVKKRSFPREPDAVAREVGVPLRGGGAGVREVTLVLVREGTGHQAVLCEPAPAIGVP